MAAVRWQQKLDLKNWRETNPARLVWPDLILHSFSTDFPIDTSWGLILIRLRFLVFGYLQHFVGPIFLK